MSRLSAPADISEKPLRQELKIKRTRGRQMKEKVLETKAGLDEEKCGVYNSVNNSKHVGGDLCY